MRCIGPYSGQMTVCYFCHPEHVGNPQIKICLCRKRIPAPGSNVPRVYRLLYMLRPRQPLCWHLPLSVGLAISTECSTSTAYNERLQSADSVSAQTSGTDLALTKGNCIKQRHAHAPLDATFHLITQLGAMLIEAVQTHGQRRVRFFLAWSTSTNQLCTQSRGNPLTRPNGRDRLVRPEAVP
jgi:hypothetical protein